MKKYVWLVLLGIGIISLASCLIYVPYEEGPVPERPYERDYGRYTGDRDISFFYEYLSPHGSWVHFSPHGYVWIPHHMRYGWRPYTHGRWVWTDYGWTWASYFEWGWVPFHYGRWGWDRHLGWYWIPGTVWGPAWVTWRYSNLYIGWAPLPPDVEFIVGIGVRNVRYSYPHHYWIFIEGRHFQHTYLDRYVLPYERNVTIINTTVHKTNITVRNNRVINEGVDIDQIRRVTRSDVAKYQLQEARQPGEARIGANELILYKPSVTKNEAAKPRRVLSKEEAQDRVSRQSLGEPDERGGMTPARLKEEQEREERLLESSQQSEKEDLIRKQDEERRLAGSTSEKEQVEKEYKVKAEELNKKHEAEKSQIKKRHEEEEEKDVKKKKIKKKEDK